MFLLPVPPCSELFDLFLLIGVLKEVKDRIVKVL
jgi:hypothetical protein